VLAVPAMAIQHENGVDGRFVANGSACAAARKAL
jgi:hypothetical protein